MNYDASKLINILILISVLGWASGGFQGSGWETAADAQEKTDASALRQLEETTVVATGLGTDADGALKTALINAVQQVVGLIVDTETLVRSDAIIRDQILTYSDGFVHTYKRLTEGKRADGLFEVRISAVVKRRQLTEKLKESKVLVTKVDGESIADQVLTERRAQENGAKLLQDALYGSPLTLLTASVTQPTPTILEKGDSNVKVSWNIEVKFNWDDYKTKMLPRLKQALHGAAKRKGSAELSDEGESDVPARGVPQLLTSSTRSAFWLENSDARGSLAAELRNAASEIRLDPQSELLILLNVGRGEKLRTRLWTWFVLDSSTASPIFIPFLSQQLRIRVTILDSSGDVLRETELPLSGTQAKFLKPFPGRPYEVQVTTERDWFISRCARVNCPSQTLQIAPYIRLDYSPKIYGEAADFVYTAELTWAEFKRVAAMRCSVVQASTPDRGATSADVPLPFSGQQSGVKLPFSR